MSDRETPLDTTVDQALPLHSHCSLLLTLPNPPDPQDSTSGTGDYIKVSLPSLSPEVQRQVHESSPIFVTTKRVTTPKLGISSVGINTKKDYYLIKDKSCFCFSSDILKAGRGVGAGA